MRIVRKFKNLTKFTYIHGQEHELEPHLPNGYTKDPFGNYFIQIGENPTTMFTCHLDTAAWKKEKVKHVFDGKYIRTGGDTILGADDKAGMVVLLYMIENKIPGLYYFFVGEEVGCVGSGQLASVWKETDFSKFITKCISFDRRGTTSVITHQFGGTCCSDDFAIDLCNKLNSTPFKFKYQPDNTGIFTDSAKFINLIPECTNISVGYYSEHSSYECQDIDFLTKLCKSVVMIDWESLIIKRDCSKDDDYFDEDDLIESEWNSLYYSYFKSGDDVKKMYISKSQIDRELLEIEEWIMNDGTYAQYQAIDWNGDRLEIEIDNRVETIGSRFDIMEFIPSLKTVSKKELSLTLKRKIIL